MVNTDEQKLTKKLIANSFCTLAKISLESRHRPTGGRWFAVQISRGGAKIKVGSLDLGL